jgi:hypothetical protein
MAAYVVMRRGAWLLHAQAKEHVEHLQYGKEHEFQSGHEERNPGYYMLKRRNM